MKIADFGLARNIREDDYYRKTTDVRMRQFLSRVILLKTSGTKDLINKSPFY